MSDATVSPIQFAGHVAHVSRDWSIAITSSPPGPPQRIDGDTIGAVPIDVGPGPHGGEMHGDGDELLSVVEGALELILDDGDERGPGAETMVALGAGDAYVVPRGVWHRLVALERSVLVHVTPGPHGEHRPGPPDDGR